MKYFGFENRDDVAAQFEEGSGARWAQPATFVAKDGFPTDDEILFALYDTPAYEGYALVLYERDGKLYEVHGSHCSCYGLEGQWQPEETTWAALKLRKPDYVWEAGADAKKAWYTLLEAHD